jgi:hypothetical protein
MQGERHGRGMLCVNRPEENPEGNAQAKLGTGGSGTMATAAAVTFRSAVNIYPDFLC